MNKQMKRIFGLLLIGGLLVSCAEPVEENEKVDGPERIVLVATDFVESMGQVTKTDSSVTLGNESWVSFLLPVNETGRYRVIVEGAADAQASCWIEDYIFNEDGRTYNITGKVMLQNGIGSVDGSPLDTGMHPVKLHVNQGPFTVSNISFELIKGHESTSDTLVQNMEGEDWKLVWSDEFDGSGLPDTTKWAYNVGNWGWGNFEPQYYTDLRTENARQEDGVLIIEAHKNDMDQPWTSARLTTQGKHAFLYGRIEFRAKVPVGRGTWAAGWLLGDSYRDELSWPYCGEIDVLECVGYEINDTTGNGINHATCHTPAYYFKKGNQIGSQIEVDSMNTKWHTYAVEWYPDRIEGYLDGEHYYTYDKTADELEWPFFKPQNIILNLAVGGGWGGAKGIDENWDSHQYILDYVRVYELGDASEE
jgi:beta-glucanase (GH16 family)